MVKIGHCTDIDMIHASCREEDFRIDREVCSMTARYRKGLLSQMAAIAM